MDKQPSIFARLRQGAQAPSRGSLYRWFLANHDPFAKMVGDVARPGWEAITAELTAEGLTMRNGQPLTVDYARQAWWKARKAVDLARNRAQNPKKVDGFLTRSQHLPIAQLASKSGDVSSNNNELGEKRVNPTLYGGLKAQRLEARVQKEVSKQEAAEADDQEASEHDADEFGTAGLR